MKKNLRSAIRQLFEEITMLIMWLFMFMMVTYTGLSVIGWLIND